MSRNFAAITVSQQLLVLGPSCTIAQDEGLRFEDNVRLWPRLTFRCADAPQFALSDLQVVATDLADGFVRGLGFPLAREMAFAVYVSSRVVFPAGDLITGRGDRAGRAIFTTAAGRVFDATVTWVDNQGRTLAGTELDRRGVLHLVALETKVDILGVVNENSPLIAERR